MPPGVSYQNYGDQDSSRHMSDVNRDTTDIRRTVKDQEAQFERLTRELEAERQSVAHKVQQYRIGSETESMNSISSTDDTFQWGGPQDESLRFQDESHGLMDSCLQELEHRGNMNFGEDNMNYMPEDPYNSSGRGPYSGEYNSHNGGPHHDTSMHSSRVSLQSNSSNRNNPRQLKLSNNNLIGSHVSLPHDQHNSDNYAPYSSLQRNNYDDYRGSPMPSNGSPRGPGTPTRFNNQYDDYGDSYHTSPLAYQPHSPLRYGEQDSFENPMQQPQHLDSPNHNDSFRGVPDERYAPQVEDSFYRQSPMLDNRYEVGQPDNRYDDGGGVPDDRYNSGGVGPPPNNRFEGGQDPRDNYMESPRDGYHGEDRYQDDGYRGQPEENSFQGQQDYGGPPPLVDRYGQPLDDSFQGGPPPNHFPDNRYGEPLDDSYRGPQDDSFRGPPPQDERYRDDDGYRDDPNDRYSDQPPNRSFQQDPQDSLPLNNYGDDSYNQDPDRRHEGLPQVQDDPFADDPFRQKQRSLLQLRDEDPYPRGPSPGGSERMGPGSYTDRPPQYDHMDGQPSYEQDSRQEAPRPYYDDELGPTEAQMLRAPPDDYPDDGRRTPSTTGGTMKWRAPDLQEIVDYLSHPNDAIKANAAGYLTHLSYMDDGIKQKIRGLDGIPLLVDLLNSEYPEVYKNACGALKNLSYGRSHEDNKKLVRNAGGIPALIRLLRKTQDEDVKDSVTGVLWNLSSSEDLKKPIIDDGLAVLVNVVIIPHSGWEGRGMSPYQPQEPWTTVFRNATGVLRNVSSAGIEARKKLRECHGLVDSLIHTLRTAIDQNNVDNKPVENCVCTLRNLSFRIQEVEDPDFFKKRSATLHRQRQQEKGEKTGCFGGGKKKSGQKGKGGQPIDQIEQPRLPPTANEYQALWGVDAVRYFLQLLTGSNPVTLEAACGSVQNLAACDWKPAIEIRALVRKEKGLPSLVDLLTYEVERVVAASATALRNLSIDERNKELVGKYAMKQLISNLPQENRPKELTDETVCAILACLNEVLTQNQDFARACITEGGLPRLMCIVRHQTNYNQRTVKFAVQVLKTLWKFKVLHQDYTMKGYTEKDFNPPVLSVSGGTSQPNSNFSTPYNTINRPMHGQGYDDTTMSSRREPNYPNGYNTMGSNPRLVQGHSNPALDQPDRHYGSKQGRLDEIPMNDIGGPGYAPLDDQRNHRNKPPVGGVALFPNLPPGQQMQSHSGSPSQEPLYARVNKKRRDDMSGPPSPSHGMMGQEHVMMGQDQGQEGADSWV